MSCSGVANAAVIAVAHAKWGERPLLVIVKAKGADPCKDSILSQLGQKLAKWQLPDEVVFVDEIPLTATGKISKLALRAKFSDYKLSG
jgi:fatty-acyl-CoA synthase